jgi:Protein of unknown function (DUF4013)
MDIGISFGYMFEDKDWVKKILIGGVLSLIPIVNFVTLGYLVQVVRNVRDGQALPLPEWDQFGEYFMSGLWLFLIFLVYSIPIIILACLQGVGSVVLGSSSGGNEADTAATAIFFVSTCFSCLMGLWGLVIGVLSPAIIVRFAETGQFNSALRLGEVFGVISANVGNYVIVMIIIWIASGIIAPLGMIACVVGVIFTNFWAYLVSGNLLGQLASEARTTAPYAT